MSPVPQRCFAIGFPVGNSMPTQMLSTQGSPVPPHSFHTTLWTRTHLSSLLSFPGGQITTPLPVPTTDITWSDYYADTQLHHSTEGMQSLGSHKSVSLAASPSWSSRILPCTGSHLISPKTVLQGCSCSDTDKNLTKRFSTVSWV